VPNIDFPKIMIAHIHPERHLGILEERMQKGNKPNQRSPLKERNNFQMKPSLPIRKIGFILNQGKHGRKNRKEAKDVRLFYPF
jgi:hypothetical protein